MSPPRDPTTGRYMQGPLSISNTSSLHRRARKTIELKLGRKLDSKEDVHHKDENLFNGDDENLEVLFDSEHGRLFHKNRARGEKSPGHVLNNKQVLMIRRAHKSGKFSIRVLSKMFGVSRSQINRIINLRSWKHLEEIK